MKNLFTFSFLLLLMVVVSGTGCKKNHSSSGQIFALGLDAQYNFQNDQLKIEVDGQTVFSKTVTTNNVLSYAGGTLLQKEDGTHTIKVTVNNVTKSTSITLNKNQYVAIRYEQNTKAISFAVQDHLFVYD